jgi:hypothetical protein
LLVFILLDSPFECSTCTENVSGIAHTASWASILQSYSTLVASQ